METTIVFLPNASSDVENYKSLIAAYCGIREHQKTVAFDCAQMSFIQPFGLNILAGLIYSLLKRGLSVRWIAPENKEVLEYLYDQRFFEEFKVQGKYLRSAPRTTSVGLKRLEGLDYGYIKDIAAWLANNSKLPGQVIRDTVDINLVEVINNVKDHSKSPIGCYICAQAYHKKDQLILSIVDLGVGFLQTLKPFYKELKSDVDAIHQAALHGLSSKSQVEKRLRGVGLSVIRRFSKKRGTLEIISSTGYWKQDKQGRITKRELTWTFPGTAVNLCLDISALRRLELNEGEVVF